MVITIGRSCGSGGLEIAQKLADRLGVRCYDADALLEEATRAGCAEEMRAFLAEKPVNSLLFSIAVENNARGMGRVPFTLMHQIAEREDFVLLGHCGNYALRDRDDLTTLFIHGELEQRVQRIMRTQDMSEREARRYIHKTDEARRHFHEFYTGEVWGEAEKYDLTVNSFALGVDATVELLDGFIQAKKAKQ
ncbi:AAA family ATPase [Butyricicoccus pullicaecorum]|uniref:Cytidylate kinase n=1 Tax=Butyricicoccus pullicaecorum 1.2 TaxID=1203606 RepID=R8VUL8_9FIRM|nr:cytidylate kinase-like family protein [Butyricicoccus pullicaecorum]EOQ36248.1 hypothetical protein HMPREF1526_02281 [Butyricicoccus pullicaecorum 1.2]SKA59878.1 cytidylate kinase [Butyricicoccus pullicaecorum DSM 23266]